MRDLSLATLAALITPHLQGIACLLLFERGEDGWQTVERFDFDDGAGAVLPPDDGAVDFAARAGRPTHLPQGEEGSDFCLLDARSTLYLPLEGGQKLLYVAGTAADAFSSEGVEAAWQAVNRPLPNI